MSDFFADFVNRPITVEGKDVILMPDLVGQVPLSEQHLYVELQPATNQTPAIHVNETDIENLREAHPKLKVYGLWQTLLNSGLISFRKSLQVVQSSPMDGYYIHCDLGRAEFSGDYEAGFFAADASFNLDDAAVISPKIESLVLPENTAKMADELHADRKRKSRESWVSMASFAAVFLVIALFVDFSLLKYHEYKHKDLTDKSSMRDYLQTGLNSLKTSRLTQVPNDQMKIERIAELWAHERLLRTDGAQKLKQKKYSFVFPDYGVDPKKTFSGIRTKYKAEGKGSWLISVAVGAK